VPLVVKTKKVEGVAKREFLPDGTPSPHYVLVVDLKDGPFDWKLRDRIAQVAYTDIEKAVEKVGKDTFLRVWEQGEEVPVKIDVSYHDYTTAVERG
jgi:hypothetical protein